MEHGKFQFSSNYLYAKKSASNNYRYHFIASVLHYYRNHPQMTQQQSKDSIFTSYLNPEKVKTGDPNLLLLKSDEKKITK